VTHNGLSITDFRATVRTAKRGYKEVSSGLGFTDLLTPISQNGFTSQTSI